MKFTSGIAATPRKTNLSTFSSTCKFYTSIIAFSLLTLFSCKTTKLAEIPLKQSDHIHPDRCLLTVNTTGDSLATLFLAYNGETHQIDTISNMQQVEGCLGIAIKNLLECDCAQELLDATADSTKSILQSGYAGGLYAFFTKNRTTFGFDRPIYRFSRTGNSRINKFPSDLDSTNQIGVYTNKGQDMTLGEYCDTTTTITRASIFLEQNPLGDPEEDYMLGPYLSMLGIILQTNIALKTAGELSSAMSSKRIPKHLQGVDLYELPEETRKEREIDIYNAAGKYRSDQHIPAMQALEAVTPTYIAGVQRYQQGCPGPLNRFMMQGMDMSAAAERLPGIVEQYRDASWPDSTYIPPTDTLVSPQSCFSTSMTGTQSFTINATCEGVSFMVTVFSANGVRIGDVTNISDGSTVHIEHILANQLSGLYYVQIVALPSGEVQTISISK